MAAAVLLAACGESASSDSNETAGTYHLKVTEASFPAMQRLGQTSLLTIGVRNTGEKTVPDLALTFSIGGKEGANSPLPFGVRDPQVGLAQPERPVWVLAQTYPRLAGSSEPGGATTSNRRTFAFGPLKPGHTVDAVFKLSAVRQGNYALLYEVDAGLSGEEKAKTTGGVAPGGTIRAEISQELPETEVADNGEIVEIQKSGSSSGE